MAVSASPCKAYIHKWYASLIALRTGFIIITIDKQQEILNKPRLLRDDMICYVDKVQARLSKQWGEFNMQIGVSLNFSIMSINAIRH